MREESSYWWLELIAGILITALAIWVSTSDRAWGLAERGYFILVFVGFMAIFRGISDIFIAFTLRKLGSQDVPPQPRRSPMETTPTTA
jgi:uncharacterized membrane protein HdeD (DUF308 family)